MSYEPAVIRYADGAELLVEDRVVFDGEPATVSVILATPEQVAAAEMLEPAVGFITASMGEIFQSPADRGWDGIKLLGRRT